MAKRCKVTGCDGPNYARSMCEAHYRRVLRHGDPVAEIPVGEVMRSSTLALKARENQEQDR